MYNEENTGLSSNLDAMRKTCGQGTMTQHAEDI